MITAEQIYDALNRSSQWGDGGSSCMYKHKNVDGNDDKGSVTIDDKFDLERTAYLLNKVFV